MVIHPAAGSTSQPETQMSPSQWLLSQRITKVIRIHPLGAINVSAISQWNPADGCKDILVTGHRSFLALVFSAAGLCITEQQNH